MTAERFREIASSPGDNVPLNPKLAAIWEKMTNATITMDMKYADGRTIKDEMTGSRKTVQGNYVVTTLNSELYKQPIDSIMAYDEKVGCYKVWDLYGDTITHALMVYDVDKKIYSTSSTFGDGYSELGVGSYSDTNDRSHTVVLKNGILFSTRDVNVGPAKPASNH
ncbi:MAG TPA: hypothetical protein VN873_17895 [Candidatus Angelobacter sp.]|nr:hypothetical protein [Candidatus Angelobacter sp.]